jgi:hypothetical protein
MMNGMSGTHDALPEMPEPLERRRAATSSAIQGVQTRGQAKFPTLFRIYANKQ